MASGPRLSDRGALYSFGWGGGGGLGHGDQADQRNPKIVAALQGVRICVVAASMHSLVVSGTGVVYSFGPGYYGQLGHGDAVLQADERRGSHSSESTACYLLPAPGGCTPGSRSRELTTC